MASPLPSLCLSLSLVFTHPLAHSCLLPSYLPCPIIFRRPFVVPGPLPIHIDQLFHLFSPPVRIYQSIPSFNQFPMCYTAHSLVFAFFPPLSIAKSHRASCCLLLIISFTRALHWTLLNSCLSCYVSIPCFRIRIRLFTFENLAFSEMEGDYVVIPLSDPILNTTVGQNCTGLAKHTNKTIGNNNWL